MRVMLPLVALALVAPTAVHAFAADEARPTAMVGYGDLDLRTSAGVRRLRVRINSAAFAICVPSGFHESGNPWSLEARQCRREAVKSAQPRLQLAIAEARGSQLASADSAAIPVVGAR